MTRRFEAGDIVMQSGTKGIVKYCEAESEDPQRTIYRVAWMGGPTVRNRETHLRPALCDDHGETIVYSEKREDWICPFCL